MISLFFLLAKKASKAILVNVTKTNALKNRLNDRSCEVKFSSRKVFFCGNENIFFCKKKFFQFLHILFTYFSALGKSISRRNKIE